MDMEFVQFFPIGHLAPRLVGMDPIMWDPFRYKLGGRLLNSELREFVNDYGNQEGSAYNVTRDRATYAILNEVKAGRGSPAGGVYLSFQHLSETALREAFGPVIDRLAANGIDLSTTAVEVAPIAHYHMGGVRVDVVMETRVHNLFAAGELVAGANGANRLSGNAITEALVFGRIAGTSAAARARASGRGVPQDAITSPGILHSAAPELRSNFAAAIMQLQDVMADDVGPFRTRDGLLRALERITSLKSELGACPPGMPGPYNQSRVDWFDLRSMVLVAEAITRAALAREESRGAHQRDDFPEQQSAWVFHQTIALVGEEITLNRAAVHGETLPEAA
jgi:succinate dehydrogenase / fumarate reductase flavoprotein subunit/fumarate reductase (CoM/CoB) subunit A